MKCYHCKKKMQLGLNFKCKCEKEFCLKHKNPEDHECTFDFQLSGKEKIKIENPLIINEKVIAI